MIFFISSLEPSAPEFLFFYDLYIFIKLLVLSIVYCFPAFVQVSYCIFYSTPSYLKWLFWILHWINHTLPIGCEYWRFLYFVGVMVLWVHVPWSFVVLFFQLKFQSPLGERQLPSTLLETPQLFRIFCSGTCWHFSSLFCQNSCACMSCLDTLVHRKWYWQPVLCFPQSSTTSF